MEKKTMGQFISALRRVNGLTQRELAERLNVSDKAVSRWERDESAPDLTLIPVIADLFGVTSDELLRGERAVKTVNTATGAAAADAPAADPAEGKRERAKSERQVAYLLRTATARFANHTLLVLTGDLLGLVAALLCNFAFNRSLLGFFLHAAFFVAAVITRRVFLAQALTAVDGPDFEGEELDRAKRKMVRRYLLFTGIGVVLFAFSLPLALMGSAYWGLFFSDWLAYGLLCAVIAALVCFAAGSLADAALIRRGTYTPSGKEWYRVLNRKFRTSFGIAAAITAGCFALFVGALLLFNALCDPTDFVEGKEFGDTASFIAYMEQPKHYVHLGDRYEEVEEPTLWDEETGTAFSPEGPLTELKLDAHTTITFHYSNQTVWSFRPGKEEAGGLPIRTYTMLDYQRGERVMNWIGVGIALLLLAADAAVIVTMLKKQKERTNETVKCE